MELEAELRAASQDLTEANIIVDNLVAIVDANVKRAEAAEAELATLRADNERLVRERDEARWERDISQKCFQDVTKSSLDWMERAIAAEAERYTLLAQVERLREIVVRYGDRMRMSYAPTHLQQDIDEAFAAEASTALSKEPS